MTSGVSEVQGWHPVLYIRISQPIAFIAMVSSSLYAPLAALITYVTTVSAAPSVSPAPRLTARTSIPNVDVDGVKNLKVITTVVNTGGETLKPLNDPRGVLDPFAENTFTITNSAGSSSSSNGAKVNNVSGYTTNLRANGFGLWFQATYTPINAGGLDGPSAFTVIAPGDSTDVTHDCKWIPSIAFDLWRMHLIE